MRLHRSSMILGSALFTIIGLVATSAHATSSAAPAAAAHEPERVQLLADVVVNGTQQPAPAPAPAAPVIVEPQTQAVAPVAPVEVAPHRTTVVEHENHNYMATIAWSAITGGVAGALVGTAIYFLADNQTHATRIAYWGAGGVLVGTAVGITQLAVQESRVDRATATRLPADPAPTFRMALLRKEF